jgi:hypothetical protein
MGGQGGLVAEEFIVFRALGGGEGNWVRWPGFYPNPEAPEAIFQTL